MTESTESKPERADFKCDKCEFMSVNQSIIKKHIKRPHTMPSPTQKKHRLSQYMSVAIVEDVLQSNQDSCEEEPETDKELKKLEIVNFEEKRVDD